MAEGFTPIDYATVLETSQVKDKVVWLFRIPRNITPSSLEGAKVKLPLREFKEGKSLGRVCREGVGANGSARLVMRCAEKAESTRFRALWTDQTGGLVATGPFAGQVNVNIDPSFLPKNKRDAAEPVTPIVEPYQGRPQLKGMRVRSKLLGGGTEYKTRRPKAKGLLSPKKGRCSKDGGGDANRTEIKNELPEIVSPKKEEWELAEKAPSTVSVGNGLESPRGSKKKRTLNDKSSVRHEAAGHERAVPATAVKAKKSKKRNRQSL